MEPGWFTSGEPAIDPARHGRPPSPTGWMMLLTCHVGDSLSICDIQPEGSFEPRLAAKREDLDLPPDDLCFMPKQSNVPQLAASG